MGTRARKKTAEWWTEHETKDSSAEEREAQSDDKSDSDADRDTETALANQTLDSLRKGALGKKKKGVSKRVGEPADTGTSSGRDTGEAGESAGSYSDREPGCSDQEMSDGENECSDTQGDCEPNAPKRRKKRRTQMLPEQLREAERQANAKGITEQFPRFGKYVFPSFSAFVRALEKHAKKHWTLNRFNHTLRRDAGNRRIRIAYTKRKLRARAKGAPFTDKLELIPKSLSHFEMTAKCVHGCTQSARGHGKRYPAATRYTGCSATIHAKAVLDPKTRKWCVEVDNEIPVHNHSLGPAIYDSYLTSSEIEDDTLFNEVSGMLEAEGNPRIICDIISRRLGRHYTGQNLSNFRNHRLGGAGARESMKMLLKRFSSFDGSRLLVVQDQEGLTTGMALQTGFQRAMLQRYGDRLLLDWTHNTNNCGYYLGSLMVTTANGTGFSVLDFLCVTQSKDMMRTIFRQFVEWEPSVLDKIKSVVIDKDYNEWAVLEELFPNVDVVLCQFHVLKWFNHVISLAKYNIPVALRDDVEAVLKAQVYAIDDEDFSHQQMRLAELLRSPKHQQFLVYMKDRWYSCVRMWSYASRGKIFTATNTTTNRLEAFWRQYKEALGDKQRIDLCVEAIFLHATSVLRREKKFLTDFVGKTRLQPNLDPFLRPVFAELSDYAAGLVSAQFNKYKSSASVGGVQQYFAEPCSVSDGRRVRVRVVGMRTVDEEVDMCIDGPWTCSCSFYKGCSLPCRHLLFVADSYKRLSAFSVHALAPRWKLSEAALLLDKIKVAITEASLLRVRRARRGVETALNGAESNHDLADDGGASDSGDDGDASDSGDDGDAPDFDDTWVAAANDPEKPSSRRTKPLILLTLRRGEIGEDAVVGDIEKRNTVRSQLEHLTTYMMAQGVSRFRSCVTELDAVLAALLESWQLVSAKLDSVVGSEAEKSREDRGVCDDVAVALPCDEMVEGLPQDVQDEIPHTDEPVAEQNQYAFDEDCGGCGNTNLANAMSPMRLTHVHSPWTSPSPADMFGDFDYYDVPVLLDAAVERGAGNGYSPPPPSVVADFQKQRPADPTLTRAASVAEMIAKIDTVSPGSTARPEAKLLNDYNGTVPNESSETAVASMEPAGLSSRSRQLLRDIDQKLIDEHAVQVSATDSSSHDTRMGTKRKINDISDEALDAGKEHRARANTVIDSIVTQAVLSRGHRRRTLQKGPSKGRRRVAVDVESDCPVYLEDLLLAVDFAHLSVAKDVLAKYTVKMTEKIFEQRGARATRSFVVSSEMRLNYVIPRTIFNILDAAVKATKEKDHVEDSTTEIGHQRVDRHQYVTTIVGTAGQLQFSEDNINDIRGFFERQRQLAEYTTDLQWLTAKVNWGTPNGRDLRPVPFLQAEVNDLEGLVNTLGTQILRDEVRSILDRSSIETVLSVPGKSCRIAMKSISGRLARRTMLNDAVVNFALNLFASAYDDVVVIDSLNYGQMVYPSKALRDIRVVIFPLNFGQAHWGVICASLPAQPGATTFLYEALGQAYWQDQLTTAWKTWCLPLLEAWASRDEIREGATVDLTRYLRPRKLKDVHLQYTATPKQLDSSSCGLFCVLQGYVYITDQYELHNFESLNAFQVKIIRVRLMWYILSRAEMSTDPIHVASAAQTLTRFAAS